MARIHLGTSSWAEPELIRSGRFYPPEARDSLQRLAYYATRFDVTEIDSTYYAMPSSRNFTRWSEGVPNDFRFIVKVFSLFSQHPTPLKSIPASFHEALPADARTKSRCYLKDVPPDVVDSLWNIFRGALGVLRDAGKLGAVLVDLPPWYVPSTANRDYLAHLAERLSGLPTLIEFRTPSWLETDALPETQRLLRQLGLGYACVDEPPAVKGALPPIAFATAPAGAVRFRGRNAQHWSDRPPTGERLDWRYDESELAEWLPRIHRLAAETSDLFLTFSTKRDDQGVVNAAKLRALLGLHEPSITTPRTAA